jgi:hypothetical protein
MPVKNLIMAYATNARFDDYYRFVASLRGHCHPEEVDVAVFIDAIGGEFAEVALDLGATLVPVVNVWKWCRNSKLLNLIYHANMAVLRLLARCGPASHRPWLRESYRHTVAEWVHPQAGRWLAYRDYLEVNAGYGMVMTSDLRDVVFQASLFAGLDPEALHVFEQEGIRYGDEEDVDTRWYRSVYGEGALGRVAGRTTLCSGTVLGGIGPMWRCLELMGAEVLRHPRVPLDQAIFNEVIAHRFDGGRVVRHGLTDGPVLTLAGDHEGFWEIRDGRVMVDGRVVPVVHMYDRHPRTKELFLEEIPVPATG